MVYTGDRGLVGLDVTQGNSWPLTTDPGDRSPVFSPDGNKIAVSYRQGDHWEVHVMNADGSGRVRLTETSTAALAAQETAGKKPQAWNNVAPAWSPDGKQIAFLTDRSGQWEMWVMNADGSNQHPLATAGALGGTKLQYDFVDERVASWH